MVNPSDAPTTLIRDAEVDGRRVDVRLADGLVVELGPVLDRSGVEELVEAGGGALLPGLHDHHAHLLAMAARAATVDLDDCADPSAFDARLRTAAADDARWIRAGGYDEHRHGRLDRARLDALVGARAARVQHRTGLSWVLSSAALGVVGIDDAPDGIVERGTDDAPTGWIHRGDEWLRSRVDPPPLALDRIGAQLAAYGITGITDATAEMDAERLSVLRSACELGAVPQHLMLLGVDDPSNIDRWAQVGPRKLLVDEVRGLDPDSSVDRIRASHALGRPVALHAVTRAENVLAVSALLAAGPMVGDRIEHGSVLPLELDAAIAAAGIVVVVQPALVGERGDHHLRAVDADDLPLLHRQASMLAAGVRLAAGSDAPVTAVDPWRAIGTASTRRSREGVVIGEAERVDPAIALGWYLTPLDDPGGAPRRVEVGAPADLCLLQVPLAEMLASPDASRVGATWIDGVMVHP